MKSISHHLLDIPPNNTGTISCLGRVTHHQYGEFFKYIITWHKEINTANTSKSQITVRRGYGTSAKDEISVEFTRSGSSTLFCTVRLDISPALDNITSTGSITLSVQGKVVSVLFPYSRLLSLIFIVDYMHICHNIQIFRC